MNFSQLLTKFLSQGVEDGSEAATAGPSPGRGGRPRLVVFGNSEAAFEILVVVRGRTAAELHLHVLGIDVKSRLGKGTDYVPSSKNSETYKVDT